MAAHDVDDIVDDLDRQRVTLWLKPNKNAPDDEAYELGLEESTLEILWEGAVQWIQENKNPKAPHIFATVEIEGFIDAINGEHPDPDIDGNPSLGPPYSPFGVPTLYKLIRTENGVLYPYSAPNPSPGYRQSPMSNFNSPSSFTTASSPATFVSARSTYNSPAYMSANGYSPAMRIETIREDEPPEPGLPAPLVQLHKDYYSSLRKREIIQPFEKELNWSGKGQHVTFSAKDEVPLLHISHLGSSMSASVDKVLCRRVALARKTMRCDRKWTVADALQEVYHLQNLRHFHIVQLVGTYLQGRNFSILMYPAADAHLGRFLEDTLDINMWASKERRLFLYSALGCLASGVAFIHQHTTKHMDIKPQNILVRRASDHGLRSDWRVYIADFGLSRSFASQDHSQTDGPTSRTPRYCAPEVYNCEQRGRSADVFSLGCVFLEILTTICYIDLHNFTDARRGDGDDESFHANLDRAVEWACQNLAASSPVLKNSACAVLRDSELETITSLVIKMVAHDPEERPTSEDILTMNLISPGPCCRDPQESFEAYQRLPTEMVVLQTRTSSE
ncbi:hypothetical protein AG0111_0g11992 [Alternaria gaisen]|uniref:Uncharacterized protein n=1 Tax=Alternaria gaisen TaxID=167740 RepID=A0ACB6F5Z9_9PLEO|nr:hypothetical protein AG0111_0g11992 [Alternaria gaisen]